MEDGRKNRSNGKLAFLIFSFLFKMGERWDAGETAHIFLSKHHPIKIIVTVIAEVTGEVK